MQHNTESLKRTTGGEAERHKWAEMRKNAEKGGKKRDEKGSTNEQDREEE